MLYELHGRSGMGMNGIAPLTPMTIEAMSRLKGFSVTPLDVEALLYLDALMLNPGDENDG